MKAKMYSFLVSSFSFLKKKLLLKVLLIGVFYFLPAFFTPVLCEEQKKGLAVYIGVATTALVTFEYCTRALFVVQTVYNYKEQIQTFSGYLKNFFRRKKEDASADIAENQPLPSSEVVTNGLSSENIILKNEIIEGVKDSCSVDFIHTDLLISTNQIIKTVTEENKKITYQIARVKDIELSVHGNSKNILEKLDDLSTKVDKLECNSSRSLGDPLHSSSDYENLVLFVHENKDLVKEILSKVTDIS